MTDLPPAIASFRDRFDRDPEVTASAPGRVNLIGEHTDYNGGHVLPTAIPQRTHAALARRDDPLVQAWSREVSDPGRPPARYQLGGERRGGGWLDHVQGVTQVLLAGGHAIGGFDLALASRVPLGAGLASSAALEVALLRALRAAFGLSFNDLALALLAQRAQHTLVGAPVGIMDPLAACLADTRTALCIDSRSLEARRIAIPDEVVPVVIDSGIAHEHAGSGNHRKRRQECERAAELLGVPQLRDLSLADLPRAASLPGPLGRRVRHVVTEDLRVLDAVEALEQRDLAALRELFAASHRSMRDDFEVSLPEIDLMVEVALEEPELVAARMTGGGFGGAVVMLAHHGMAVEAAQRVASAYAIRTRQVPTVLVPAPYADRAW